jgi:transcriptional regulator with XRE-family HTH domain
MIEPYHRRASKLTRTSRLLTEAREALGLSQIDIVELTRRSRRSVIMIENGQLGIPGEEVLAFSRAYKVDPVTLLRALERDRKPRP